MLPGALIAITGAVLFAFFETGANYKYIHSAWHITLSMSIIFLLPPPLRAKGWTTVFMLYPLKHYHAKHLFRCYLIV